MKHCWLVDTPLSGAVDGELRVKHCWLVETPLSGTVDGGVEGEALMARGDPTVRHCRWGS